MSNLSGYRGVMSRALSRSFGMKLTLNGAVCKVSEKLVQISQRRRCHGIEQNKVGHLTLTFINGEPHHERGGGSEAKW